MLGAHKKGFAILVDTSFDEIVHVDPSEFVLEEPSEHPLKDQVEVDESNTSLVLKNVQPGMQVGSSNDVDDVVQDILNPCSKSNFNKLCKT